MPPARIRTGRPDWTRIKAAYIVKGWSAQRCASEFGVNPTTVKIRASKEGWTAERNRNATAGAEVVAEEMKAAAADEIRAHAKRLENLLQVSDGLIARLKAEAQSVPPRDLKRLKTVIESYRQLAEAVAKGVGSDRLVRGIADGASSDAGARDEKPTMIRFVVVDPRKEGTADAPSSGAPQKATEPAHSA